MIDVARLFDPTTAEGGGDALKGGSEQPFFFHSFFFWEKSGGLSVRRGISASSLSHASQGRMGEKLILSKVLLLRFGKHMAPPSPRK